MLPIYSIIGGFLYLQDFACEENHVEQLSAYLGVANPFGLPVGWSRPADVSLALVNQLDSKKSITKSSKGAVVFNESLSDWGFKSFVPVSELHNRAAGYLVSNMCIIKAKVATPLVKIEDPGTEISSKNEFKNKEPSNVSSGQAQIFSATPRTNPLEMVTALEDTPSSKPFCTNATNGHPAGPSAVEIPAGVSTTASPEDFRGLGHIDKHLVPLLEEVCSQYPSLSECQKNRSRSFSECAFKSLGTLLHILKTTKVKDMTEEKLLEVQKLLEELEVFGFDLAWLKAYIQSGLGRKNFMEMLGKVVRLREHVDELKAELKRQKTLLFAAEVNLEIKTRDLGETEELDLNSEMGIK